MSFPRYPQYKDSGVEWLGEVPGHWALKRLKQACHVFPSNVDKKSYDGETPVQLCNYTDVYYNDTIVAGTDFMAATATEDQVAKFTLRAGDTIITKDSETADDIAIAAYVPADLPGVICGYHLSMIRPIQEANGAFVKRLFDSTYVKSCVAVRANGLTRVGLGQYEIDNLDLPFPPLPEQTQIAAFLDRETAKIDALVAEQRRLMALLKEKRQAVISHAVTRGLNPDAPMKPSGIEWLGDVPAHWDAPYLGALIETADLGGNYESSESGDGIPLIKMGNLDRGFIKTSKVEYLPAETDFSKSFILNRGDFLFNTRNSLDLVGKVAIWRNELPHAIYNSNILRISFKKQKVGSTEFMNHFFNSDLGLSQLRLVAKGTTSVAAIYYKDLTTIRVVLPPIAVQHSIVEYLQDVCAKFDTLTTEAQRAIDLLQERRTALISAAVTGQIDVRGAV